MSSKPDSLPDRFRSFVLDSLRRGQGVAGRAVPHVVVLGPRRSGKSHLVNLTYQACADSVRVPHALVDWEAFDEPAAWAVLCALVDSLERTHPGVSRMRFPRVALARRVVTLEPQDHDREMRAHVMLSLRESLSWMDRLGTLGSIVANEGLARTVGLGDASQNALVSLMRDVSRSHRWVFWFFRHSLTHYGENYSSALDSLVRLNRHFHQDSDLAATEFLLPALLADLDDAYSGGRRPYNTAVILENVRPGASVRLLDEWARHRSGELRSTDPVLLIVTSRTWPELADFSSSWVLRGDPVGRQRLIPPIDRVAADDFREHWDRSRGSLRSSWYPTYVPALTFSQISQIVDRRRAGFVHRVTGGHPGAVFDLARALRDADGWAEFRDALDTLLRAESAREMSRHSVGMDEVGIFAVAHDLEAAVRVHPSGFDVRSEFYENLWTVRRRGRDQLHPWMRNAILATLSGTGELNRIARALKERAAPGTAESVRCDLVTGGIMVAVDHLAQRIRVLDARHWLLELDYVTSAPSQRSSGLPVGDRFEALVAERLVHEDHLEEAVHRLVAAQWLWSDPLADPDGRLVPTIAKQYDELFAHAPVGNDYFRVRRDKFAKMVDIPNFFGDDDMEVVR